MSALAEAAQAAEGQALRALGGDLAHPSIGLAILLCVQVPMSANPAGLLAMGGAYSKKPVSIVIVKGPKQSKE